MRIILFEKKIRSSLIFLQLLLFVSDSALRLFCTCALLNFEYFFDNFQKFIGICCLWVNWFWCSQTGILKVCVICLTGCQIIVILLIISCRVAMQNCLVAKKSFSQLRHGQQILHFGRSFGFCTSATVYCSTPLDMQASVGFPATAIYR